MLKKSVFSMIAVFCAFSLCGCSVLEKARRVDSLEYEVAMLKERLAALQKDKRQEKERIVSEKEKELTELEKAKQDLEKSLQKEVSEYKAKLQLTERGLVITFLSEVFFDSGKTVLRPDGKETLLKVTEVLNADIISSSITIEGHTDNDPIKYSYWKSNWELSSTRALAVLHYLVDEGRVSPERLCAAGYGEYWPVVENNSPENKQKNRRVEIVILPQKLKKVRE
ncbi:MAG: flagellar motor protein MotB [Candidatus Omnitrophica bacterium]|nr:flagellar motor protein MotB [Candidatus Omnitrophota bacterium]